MTGRVLYDTTALTQGATDIKTGAGAFDAHQQQWSGVVNETVAAWLSKDGVAFEGVNQMFRQASLSTNEFLTNLGIAVQKVSANADDTLASCVNLVNGG